MRGKPKQTFRKPTRSRITPAGAGKTLSAGIGGFLRRDHPRRCGENEIADDIIRRCGGSPPQVRGKRVIPRIRWMYIRITPAGAGKTLRQLKVCGHAWDHPRRCGENSVFRSRAPNPSGSPPQVRGKLFNLLSIIRKNRITPAGAGKTVWKAASGRVHWDHPRRCGENWAFAPVAACMIGSPPQVRGKPWTSGNLCA